MLGISTIIGRIRFGVEAAVFFLASKAVWTAKCKAEMPLARFTSSSIAVPTTFLLC
jgi:hypothetical protein